MINDDPYQFHTDNDVISNTPRTRSTSRQRQLNSAQVEVNNKKKTTTKKVDQNGQTRIVTRSSQRSQKTNINQNEDDGDRSFMSDIKSGFSQFVNSKKRPREEKKIIKPKRARKEENHVDENQNPTEEIESEIQSIELVKLAYETKGGRNNLGKTIINNEQILANRTLGNPVNTNRLPTKDTTYITHRSAAHVIEETQTDTLAIPDTLMHNESQHNDSSWQKDIDRLMRKLEEPSTSCLIQSPIQIEETVNQEETEDENHPFTYLNLTERTQTTNKDQNIHSTNKHQQIINQTDDIAIQTDDVQSSTSIHSCCQDVSICPCVLRYSKLERLFMEKMSKFISIVPTVHHPTSLNPTRERLSRSRSSQRYSRWRQCRVRRRTFQQSKTSNLSNDQSTSEEIDDLQENIVSNEMNNQFEINIVHPEQIVQSQNSKEKKNDESIYPNENKEFNQNQTMETENRTSTTTIKENTIEGINELSTIDKIDRTINPEHPSTLLISIANENSTINSTVNDRRLVLTASSLDENQKIQYRQFVSRFEIATTSNVDSSTTHVIVSEHSSLVCPLTGKVIQGIARHLFIVSFRWLKQCLKEETIVDERPFEIHGDTSLGSDHGGMRRSRLTPSYLLSHYSICLRCSSSDCAPLQNVEQVQEIIELCGGKLFHHFSQIQSIDKQKEIVLVLGINGFVGSEKKRQALLDTCQQFNVKCVNIHWLLISIAKFDIQPFDVYDIH